MQAFVEETGSDRTWECESLDPEYLQEQLRAAILANMNLEIFEAAQAREIDDIKLIQETRAEIARGFIE